MSKTSEAPVRTSQYNS